MIKHLFLFLFLLSSGYLSAQRKAPVNTFAKTWKANGTVLDSATKKPVAGVYIDVFITSALEATVLMDDSLVYSCVSDSAGHFAMPPVVASGGSCTFRFAARKPGYTLPRDLWAAKYDYRKSIVTATVWVKHSKSLVRLIPKDD